MTLPKDSYIYHLQEDSCTCCRVCRLGFAVVAFTGQPGFGKPCCGGHCTDSKT